MGNEFKLSEYPYPSPGDRFLTTADHRYYYQDLFDFADALATRMRYKSDRLPRNVLLVSELNLPLVFTIATCWLAGITFIPVDPRKFSKWKEVDLKGYEVDLVLHEPDIATPDAIPALELNPSILQNIKEQETDSSLLPPGLSKQISLNSVFAIFHSSGTTGDPKQTPLKRRQLYHAVHSSQKDLHMDPNSSWLLCLPPYHIGGAAVILRSILMGSAIHLIEEFQVEPVRELLQDKKHIIAASLVPTMLKRLLDAPRFTTHSRMKGILLGGGPSDPELLADAVSRNIPIIKSYGTTETCAQITSNPLWDKEAYLNSVGSIFSPNKIEIRNADGSICDTGETGLIWLKGPQIFDGYLSKRQNRTFFDAEGWFRTDDFGRLDERQQLYIEMRRTDLIVSGGKNINPHEIESYLVDHPDISQAAVIGTPDREWGEVTVAVLVLNTEKQTLNKSKLKRFLRNNQLESYKIPKKFYYWNELPRTSIGKIERSTLKARILEESKA